MGEFKLRPQIERKKRYIRKKKETIISIEKVPEKRWSKELLDFV